MLRSMGVVVVMTRFQVQAVADPQSVARIIEHFALRTLLPTKILAERDDSTLAVTIEQPGLEEATAHLILEKIRGSVLVLDASLSLLHPAEVEA